MAAFDAAAASTHVSAINKPISVLVVDPSSFSRACTLAGFNEIADMKVHACGSLEDARNAAVPDVVMFHDYHRDGTKSNLSAQLLEAANIWPGAAMLVIANPGDREQLRGCLEGGARGLLNSNVSIESTVAAIRMLLNNLVIFSDDIFELVAKSATCNGESAEVQEVAPMPHLPDFRLLTPRQQEVLGLLSLGLSNKVIGQQLRISESTVKVHIRGIMAQTGVTNRTQIVAHFLARQ